MVRIALAAITMPARRQRAGAKRSPTYIPSFQVGGSSTEPRLASTRPSLRPVRSAESLVPTSSPCGDLKALSPASVNSGESDVLGPLETVTSAVGERTGRESPKCHSRSSSHDSYFERKQSVQFKIEMDCEEEEEEEEEVVSPQLKPDSSLDMSEIQVNFDLEDNEMKIFSEDEAMMSTSVGSEVSLIRSPLEETASGSPATGISRGVRQRSQDNLESPTKSRRMSFKEKFRKFTSPTLSRKQQQGETNKMVDSGVGFESDSCSGSYESGKGSKLKEKLVSALSPESLRKSEGSPKKMKPSNSPQGSSPQTIVKKSKIEDDDCEMSSLNLSPSIRFIDASSSYELGGATSSETLGDCRPGSHVSQTEDNWCEGLETTRRGEEEVVVQVHHEDDTVKGFADGPISIIGTIASNPPSLSDSESAEQMTAHTPASVFSATGTVLSQPTPHSDSTPQFEASTQSEATVNPDAIMPSETTLPYDAAAQSDATSQSENTIQSEVRNHSMDSSSRSDISLSLAAATVSENESFGLDSTNDEASANAEDTFQSSRTVEEVICGESEEGGKVQNDIQTSETREGDDMEVEVMREVKKVTKEVSVTEGGLRVGEESDQMETDMTIVSAESGTSSFPSLRQLPSFDASSEGPTDQSNNTTDQSPGEESSEGEDESSLGSNDVMAPEQTETPADESKHLTDEKTSSGIDCHLLSLVTDSTITPEFSSSSLPEVVTSPPEVSAVPPPASQPEETKLKLSLVSPQLESVVMRRSPSSPARNRCVRSDFFSNLGDAGLPGGAADTQVGPVFPSAPAASIHHSEPSVMEEEEEDAKEIEEKDEEARKEDQSVDKKSETSPMEQSVPLQKDSPSPITLPSPDIGLPPLPRSSPPKPVTALAKAMLTSPQPYMKPLSGPQPYSRPSPTPRPRTSLTAPLSRPMPPEPQERAPTIQPAPMERSLSVEPQKSSPQAFRRSLSEPPEQEEGMVEAVTLRLQSLSPMEEAEAETRSLELPSPSPQDGRRSTQGIPEVCVKKQNWHSSDSRIFQIEKKIKFSNTESSSQFEQSPRGNRRKVGGNI